MHVFKQLGPNHLCIRSHVNSKIWSKVSYVSFQTHFFILLEGGPTNTDISEIIHI